MNTGLKSKPNTHSDQEASLRVSSLGSLGELKPLRAQIDALTQLPFLQTAWMFPWIEAYCTAPSKLHFLLVRNSASVVVGYAPLVLQDSLKRGRHFVFVGSGKACADYMSFPALAGYEAAVATAVADWLHENENLWDRIELDGIEASNTQMIHFAASMEGHDCQSEAVSTLPSFRMNLPNDWEEFLSSLSKNSRKKYRRQARALDGKSELHRATDRESLEEGLRILETLHTQRWNSLGEGGCFASPKFGEFLNGMAQEKLAAGTLSLIWLTFEGQPIAADIGYYGEGGLFTYQGGLSPDHLNLEPGRAIIKSQMELAMQHNLTFIDFLRGDEPYKSRFDTRRINNVRYEITGRGTRARLIQSILQIGRAVKSLLG
jgi:CelD/BcsL family acetyltransferase involved in cellulose biosynthesis